MFLELPYKNELSKIGSTTGGGGYKNRKLAQFSVVSAAKSNFSWRDAIILRGGGDE